MQEKIATAFYDPTSRIFHRVNQFFSVVTVVAILSVTLETVESLGKYKEIFLWVEYGVVFLFLLEYLGRIIGAQKPFAYMTSFFGIIDLVSILPSLLGIANLSAAKGVRFVRLLRLFRLLRLLRTSLTRASGDMRHDIDDESFDLHSESFRVKVEIYGVIFILATLLSASAMWFAEGYRADFANIPITVLWSIKVLLGGAPSAAAETIFGEVIIICTRFLGLLLFGLLISIVGAGVKKLLFGVREHSSRTENMG